MIAHVRGRLLEAGPGHVVLEVGGVGLEVKVPAGVARALPEPGEMVTLYTHLHVRDDEIALYGFATSAERELFRTLQGVSGVGPRLALAIVGGCPPGRFWQAVFRQDASLLGGIPGVGRKTISRLLVELRDRVPAAIAGASQAGGEAGEAAGHAAAACASRGAEPAGGTGLAAVRDQARDALFALGYSHREANEAIAAALEALGPGASTDDVIVAALRWLGRQGA